MRTKPSILSKMSKSFKRDEAELLLMVLKTLEETGSLRLTAKIISEKTGFKISHSSIASYVKRQKAK